MRALSIEDGPQGRGYIPYSFGSTRGRDEEKANKTEAQPRFRPRRSGGVCQSQHWRLAVARRLSMAACFTLAAVWRSWSAAFYITLNLLFATLYAVDPNSIAGTTGGRSVL